MDLVNKSELKNIGKKYDVTLPDIYVMHIENNEEMLNGTFATKVPVCDTNEYFIFEKFFNFNSTDDNFIENINDKHYDVVHSEKIFIFGRSKDGGLLVFKFFDDEYNVCYWDIDMKLNLSSENANVYFIASGFDDFLKIINNEKGEKIMETMNYLPLGSIVLLNGGIQKLIVIGRGVIVENAERELFFDYVAVPYPTGLVGDSVAYFNADNIAKVIYEGYSDDDDKVVVSNINKYISDNPNMIRGNAGNWVE
mgnify:CR=1 FL=1